MSEGLNYGVTLEDRMSGPAKDAASSLQNLAGAAEGGRGPLSELSGSFLHVVEPAEVMRGALEGVGAGLKAFASGIASGDAKEAVAGLTESLAGLATTLDLVYPGLGQVASAAIKAGGAFAAMTVGLVQSGAELAIEATQGKQAMISMFGALGGGVEAGRATEEMLSGLSEEIGITKDQLAPLTRSFMAMGIEGTENLKRVTLAAASAQAIMGDPSAANAFETLTKKIQVAAQTGQGLKIPAKGLGSLAEAGLTVDDVAKRMNVSAAALGQQLAHGTVNAKAFGDAMTDALVNKGAGPLQRMSSSLASLKGQLGQSLEDMFEDMGDAIDPVLAQVKDMFSVFSSGSESGKAIKAGIGGAFRFIFDAASKVIPMVKHFFLDVVIWSLKGYIMLRQHWSAVTLALKGVAIVLGGLAAIAIGAFALVVGPMLLASAAVGALYVGIAALGLKIQEFAKSAADAGVQFVAGLVGGIMSGASQVADAVGGLADKAKKSIKSAFGISSPSKFGLAIGENVGGSVAGGLDNSAGDVADASRGLVSGAAKGINAADYGGGGAGGGGGTGPITINLTAPNGVSHALELTEIAVAAIFERLMLQQGA